MEEVKVVNAALYYCTACGTMMHDRVKLCDCTAGDIVEASVQRARQPSANKRQVGGDHYKIGGEEHWDRVNRLGLDYFQGQITKYVERWKKKNGVQDLEKARHFLDKYIELERSKAEATGIAKAEREYHADDARG